MEQPQRPQQRDKDEVIQHRIVGQVKEAHVTARVDGEAIITAVLLQADREEIAHLRKRQRDHDEGHAAGAHHHCADQSGEHEANHKRRPQMQPAIGNAMKRQDADRVGAQADIQRMAETHQTTKAENEVQRDAGQRINHDARKQRDVKWLIDPRRVDRQQCEEQQHQCRHKKARTFEFEHRVFSHASPGTGLVA